MGGLPGIGISAWDGNFPLASYSWAGAPFDVTVFNPMNLAVADDLVRGQLLHVWEQPSYYVDLGAVMPAGDYYIRLGSVWGMDQLELFDVDFDHVIVRKHAFEPLDTFVGAEEDV